MQWCWLPCRIYLIVLNWVAIWTWNIHRFGSMESWPVGKYFPCICRGKKTWKSSVNIEDNPAEFRIWYRWNKVSILSPTEVSLTSRCAGKLCCINGWLSVIDFVNLFINYVSCIPMEAIWHRIWRVAHCQWRVEGHDTGYFESVTRNCTDTLPRKLCVLRVMLICVLIKIRIYVLQVRHLTAF